MGPGGLSNLSSRAVLGLNSSDLEGHLLQECLLPFLSSSSLNSFIPLVIHSFIHSLLKHSQHTPGVRQGPSSKGLQVQKAISVLGECMIARGNGAAEMK